MLSLFFGMRYIMDYITLRDEFAHYELETIRLAQILARFAITRKALVICEK